MNTTMNTVLTCVSLVTGLKSDHIFLNTRYQHGLFARYIAIQLLKESGLTHQQIAAETQRTRQAVGKALKAHEQLLTSDYRYRNTFHLAHQKFAERTS